MSNFDFNDMSDEEFRKEFIKFLNKYQRGLESFTKKFYNSRDLGFMSNPFFNIYPIGDDMLKDITNDLGNMNTESGVDENGEWEKRSWLSPDGTSSFTSYTRNSFYNPSDSNVKFMDKSEEMGTIKLLEKKLNESIDREDYESAAKIRDLIKSLKEG